MLLSTEDRNLIFRSILKITACEAVSLIFNIFVTIPPFLSLSLSYVYLTGHRIKSFFAHYACNPRYILYVPAVNNFDGFSFEETNIANFLDHRPERSEGIVKERL